MSKKTPLNTPKKPDPKAAGERALKQRKIATEEEALRIRRIVSNMLEPVHERLRAIESRSAPAEVWKPKVGDYIARTKECRYASKGDVGIVDEVCSDDMHWCWFPRLSHRVACDVRYIRPATPAEIADHKAKEDQRAKEAEWAKYTEIQNHDTIAWTTEQERDELLNLFREAGLRVANGPESYKSHTLIVDIDPTWAIDIMCDSRAADLPFAEGKRRLQGTIAKRAEDERAKELAKPLEMGMKVRTKEYGEGFYWFLNDSPSDGFHRIILPKGNVATVLRDQFTIID